MGEKPPAAWKRRRGLIGVVAAVTLAGAGVLISYLQTHQPGPQYVYHPPQQSTGLADLAIEKGYPKQCLQLPIIPNPYGLPDTNPTQDMLLCVYRGHPDGQAVPQKPCVIRLTRDTVSDPYSFSTSLQELGKKRVYFGKDRPFAELVHDPDAPKQCNPSNLSFVEPNDPALLQDSGD